MIRYAYNIPGIIYCSQKWAMCLPHSMIRYAYNIPSIMHCIARSEPCAYRNQPLYIPPASPSNWNISLSFVGLLEIYKYRYPHDKSFAWDKYSRQQFSLSSSTWSWTLLPPWTPASECKHCPDLHGVPFCTRYHIPLPVWCLLRVHLQSYSY